MTTPAPPFGSSSLFENPPFLDSHGPAPGIILIQEMPDHRVLWRPASFYGLAGIDDAFWANYAYTRLTQKYPNGFVMEAVAGTYNLLTQVQVPQNPAPCSLVGRGIGSTIFQCNAPGSGIYAHRNTGYGKQYDLVAQQSLGFLRDFSVDGINALPGGTIGLDTGDGWGLRATNIRCVNFTDSQSYTVNAAGVFTCAVAPPTGFPVALTITTGSNAYTGGTIYYVNQLTATTFNLTAIPGGAVIGATSAGSGTFTDTIPWYLTNRVFWSEKQKYELELMNNSIAALFDTQVPAHDVSHEYNEFHLNIFCNETQTGIVCAAGVNMGGCHLWMGGNMSFRSNTTGPPLNNAAVLTLQNAGTQWFQGTLWWKIEANPGNFATGVKPYHIYMDGQAQIQQVSGALRTSTANAVLNGSECSFSGGISGDSGLATPVTPALTPSVSVTNFGVDATACIVAAGGTTVKINGVDTGLISGAFKLVAGGTITPGSGATSWVWVPAQLMAF